MPAAPLLTPASLIERLLADGVTTEDQLVTVLGPARKDATLPELETRLVDRDVLPEPRLAMLKGVVAGLPVFGEEDTVTAHLPVEVARAAGALVVDRPIPTVVFVEPIEENIRIVANTMRRADFEIWLCTTPRFKELLRATYQGRNVERRPAVADIFEVLDECITKKASDIHLKAGKPPVLRLDGTLTSTMHAPVDAAWIETQCKTIAGSRFDELLENKTVDLALAYGTDRFRVNLGADRDGWTIALRLLASKVPSMDDLGIPLVLRNLTELERGLVLVTGPTGSGKSTLLASIIDHIARHQSRHIITLEDPIEYLLTPGPNAVVNQRELHDSFVSFPSGLRQALRQDPDILLVGELRDAETVRIAVEASETGHLCFGTLHTYDAQSTVARLIAFYGEHEQMAARDKLAYILKAIVSQTLIPRKNTTGRIAAQEIMTSTPAIANNLRSPGGISHLRSTIQTSRKEGMQTMEMALAELARRNMISTEEAEFRAANVEEFRRYLAANEIVDD